jgi:hypothetical protein
MRAAPLQRAKEAGVSNLTVLTADVVDFKVHLVKLVKLVKPFPDRLPQLSQLCCWTRSSAVDHTHAAP